MMLNQFELQKAEIDRVTKEFATTKTMFHSACREFGFDERYLNVPVAELLAIELLKDNYSEKWYDRMSRLTSGNHNVLRDCVMWVLNSQETMKKWSVKKENIDNLKSSIKCFSAKQDAYISDKMNHIRNTSFSTS